MKKLLFIALLFPSFLLKAQGAYTSPGSQWKYSTSVDEMTAGRSYYADLNSEPSTDNNITANITIRNREQKNEVLFSIDKDLLNVGGDGLIMYVKFDDRKIEKFFCQLGTSDNEFKLVFVHPPGKFIKQLKASKKALFKIDIYNKGDEVFHFNTEGIKWDYKD